MATKPGTKRTGGGTVRREIIPLRGGGTLWPQERDDEILKWVARHGIVTVDQMAAKFFATPQGRSACYQRVRKLCAAAPPLLQRDLAFYRHPAIIRVTPAGARRADVGIAPAHIVPAEIPHALAIVDLAESLLADLLKENKETVLVTERERRAERYREKRAGKRKSTGRIPDVVFELPATKTKKARNIAVELDRTVKSRMDAEAVVRAYIAERSYSEVWWYVRPRRVDPVRQLTKRMRVDDFIEVRPWTGV